MSYIVNEFISKTVHYNVIANAPVCNKEGKSRYKHKYYTENDLR